MSEIFRDRTEGAIARRQDLLRKRRDEFVTMPHAIRRVVVARAARVAASLAMIGSGVALLLVGFSPTLAGYMAAGMPGINPAVVSTFVAAAWILGLIAYAVSRARSEHRFAVEMMSYVLPGHDLDQDIERLTHEHPDDVARRMAHRLEVSSAALPVAAAALVLPATLVYIAHALYAAGWPSTAAYEANLIEVTKALTIAGGIGAIAAIAMTRRAARKDPMAGVTGVIAVLTGIGAAFALSARAMPATWLLTVISVITATIAYVNIKLTAERAAIEATDPAAGSELFTLRGLVASCKSALVIARRRISPRLAIGAGASALLLVCAGQPVLRSNATISASSLPALRPTKAHAANTNALPTASSYAVTATHDGRLRVEVSIVDGHAVEMSELAGMSELPRGWRARVTVRLESSDVTDTMTVTPFPDDAKTIALHFGGNSTEHRFATEHCGDTTQPLGLRIVPDVGWPSGVQKLIFLVEPALELSSCDVAAEPLRVPPPH